MIPETEMLNAAAADPTVTGNLANLFGKLKGFATEYPVAAGTMAAEIPLNLIGLFDNKKIGAQLGGAALGGLASAGMAAAGVPWAHGANLAVAPLLGGTFGATIDSFRDASARTDAWAAANPNDYEEYSDLYTKLVAPKSIRTPLTPEEQARFNQLVNAQIHYSY